MYLCFARGVQTHCAFGFKELPQGHGFAAKINWNRAGNLATPADRLMVTSPLSSACLKTSSAGC
jgi:hypothetical protein